MASSATSESSQFSQDSQTWDNLKQAIAASSGFQRWQMEHPVGVIRYRIIALSRVRRYLRETLETLAY
jgi:hypothetical protein